MTQEQVIVQLTEAKVMVSRLAEFANSIGWDGVENSKLLDTFLIRTIEDQRWALAKAQATVERQATKLAEARKEIASQKQTHERWVEMEREARQNRNFWAEKAVMSQAELARHRADARRYLDLLRKAHDEASVLKYGTRLTEGPMLELTEATVLEMREAIDAAIGKENA